MNINESFGGIVLGSVFRLVVPFTYVYAIYVLMSGETGPGGGFQAGAVLSIGIVLTRWIRGRNVRFNIAGHTAVALAGLGALLYCVIGWIPIFFGGNFLDYSSLPFNVGHDPEKHALGILLIEIGVTVAVMMTIIGIMSALMNREETNDGND